MGCVSRQASTSPHGALKQAEYQQQKQGCRVGRQAVAWPEQRGGRGRARLKEDGLAAAADLGTRICS